MSKASDPTPDLPDAESRVDRLRPLVLEVPPVTGTHQIAELLNTNEQITCAWVREGIIPAHRKPGGRKFTFPRHEIFDWLIASRYEPE